MAFDLATAKPMAARTGKFDLSTARPAENVSAASLIPGASQEQLAAARAGAVPADNQEDNLLGKLASPVDAALGVASGIVSPVLAVPAGFIKSAYDEKVNGVVRSPQENATAIMERLQYQPATATGRRILEAIGTAAPVLAALPGLGPELQQLGQATRAGTGALRELAAPTAAIQNAADDAARAGGGRIRDLVRRPAEPSLAGVGAARSPEATLRQQRAASLGVSPLTQGQATREPSQVRFERNTAKTPEGGPLNNRFVQQNQELLMKFDDLREQTGAQAPSMRAAGGVIDQALVDEYAKAQKQVNAAYLKAEEAGQAVEPVSYQAISDYLGTKNAEMKTNNAPVLNYVRAKLQELDPRGTGKIPVNDLEELRKGAGRVVQESTADPAFINQVKAAIDSSMDEATGSLYQQARALNREKANRFENVGTVDKLLRTKGNSNDRYVALQDVTDHVMDNIDGMRQVRNILQSRAAGEKGAQAWREVQGAGLERLRDTLFPPQYQQDGIASARPAAFKKAIVEMDADGRLQALYGKQGAQVLRDLADTAVDINFQQGANTSNTAQALDDLFRQRATGLLKVVPGGRAIAEFVEGRAQSRAIRKRVSESLGEEQR